MPRGFSEYGIDFAQIISTYLATLSFDNIIPPDSSGPFLFTGTKGKKSKFSTLPLGKNTLNDIGKEVAKFLQLEDTEAYAGPCFDW